MRAVERPVAILVCWPHPIAGNRWGLSRDGRRTLLAYDTEQEAREAAERCGWRVVAAHELEPER